MAFATNVNNPEQAVESFKRLNVDDQLAVLWFVYTDMGSQVTPAAPGSSSVAPEIAEGLFNQVKELSHEEQLQVQRDLLSGKDALISREYGSLSANTKLLFWYRLAQGMESATIVPMPSGYELPQEGKDLMSALENLDFEQQITFLRDAVVGTGSEPAGGSSL